MTEAGGPVAGAMPRPMLSWVSRSISIMRLRRLKNRTQRLKFFLPHSYLSATFGSTFDARLAGRYEQASATRITARGVAARIQLRWFIWKS